MDDIDEISEDEGIQRGVLVAWAFARSQFPGDDDFVALLQKEDIGWQINVVPRLVSIEPSDTPASIKHALAIPAGDKQPRFPLNRAIWLVVFVDNIFKGCMRMVEPINAAGGLA